MHPTVFGDHRGVIRSFFPDDNIVEYNLLTNKPGMERGYHYHPEFVEYIMIVHGQCVFTEYTETDALANTMYAGDSVRVPKNVAHSFRAVTDMSFVSMLTKRWDDCAVPLVTIRP
jgi:quercetin dioxygenase-like cupin family protein